jgi:hypothetical protein
MLLVSSALAYEMAAPPGSTARASLTTSIAAAQTQLANVGSLPWLDAVGSFFANLFHKPAPEIVYDTPPAATPSPQPIASPSTNTAPTTHATVGAAPTTIVKQYVTNPVVERIVEKQTAAAQTSVVTLADLASLRSELLAKIASAPSAPAFTPPQVAAGGSSVIYESAPASERIDNLDNTTITNPTLSLPSVLALTNASSSLFSVFNGAYFGGTATSTFASNGALTAASLNVLGASQFANSANFFGLSSFGATATTTIATNGTITTPSIIAAAATLNSATAYSASFGATATSSFTLTQVIASSSVGSNTSFTVPTNTAYIVVEVWGGGGGGGGSGASGYGNGAVGGTSCFGTNSTACTSPLLQATGGAYGNAGGAGGNGGSGSGGDVNLTGSGGMGFSVAGVSGGSWYFTATGGSAPRGGGGAAGSHTGALNGAAFGGGGDGGGCNNCTTAGSSSGGGGGGGGYSQKTITNPSGTYYYTVGVGGSAGSAGTTGGSAGGAGGAGGVTIYVYPQPEYLVSLRTLKHIPSLRGHPEANVRNLAAKEQIPEEVLLQAWAYDNENSRNLEQKFAFLGRKYLFILLALLRWGASFILSATFVPRSIPSGFVLLALWTATILFLYLHEKEWGFAAITGLALFIVQELIERALMHETWLPARFGSY